MLAKGPYKPADHEDKIYFAWEKGGYFKPSKKGQPYSIVMPPSNVTGILHVGHALGFTIQDILIRYNRMRSKKTLWLPGTDHSAIATQSKVEELIYKKEKKTRHDLGRQEFLKRVEKFAQDSHDTIVNQTKRMGASCDWQREAYTLDEPRTKAVRTAFKKMYDDGLIYKGERIVNWDPKLQTTVSDDEVEYVEEKTPFYYLKYGPFTIATARPETKFGDKYVVMHPDDKRYKKYKHNQKIEVDWINGKVTATIIKDEVIDMEMGTGAMTITPWHDTIDFGLSEKHNLEREQIIDLNGKMMKVAGEFAGLSIKEAREKVVAKLDGMGLLAKVEKNYVHRIAINYRGNGVIEPQILKQWFVDVNKKFKLKNSKLKSAKTGDQVSLKELMKLVVKSGEIKIIPEHFNKIYFHWVDNLRDWCISRQIWYGHRIPVWYKTEIGSSMEAVSFKSGALCKKLGLFDKKAFDKFSDELEKKDRNIQWASGRNDTITLYIGYINLLKQKKMINDEWVEQNRLRKPLREAKIYVGDKPPAEIGWYQDPDTLDTWFSSGLWTFSTLGWPDETDDLKTFHPTDVLETAYDILFFWVARMILMTTYFVGDIPFKNVFLHGIVRDKDKKKMSKSKGNVVDPLGVIDDFGTDALRMALIFNVGQGSDIAMSPDKVLAQKKFANKIWNASKFVILNLGDNFKFSSLAGLPAISEGANSPRHKDDMDILEKLNKTVKSVTKDLDNFMFHEAAQDIYHFFWHDFCDVYLEDVKRRLNGDDDLDKKDAQNVLYYVLLISLKLLHPFMPFITETIYQELSAKKEKMLIIAKWPE